MRALLWVLLVVAAPAAGTTVDAETTVSGRIARADDLRADGSLREALTLLETARSDEPGDPRILWRLARVYVGLGDRAPKGERLELYEKARGYAEKATSIAPEDPNGHLWLAISFGKLADVETSARKQLALAADIEREAIRTLELEPGQDEALYMLASLRYEMAVLPWYQKAVTTLLPGDLPEGSLHDARQFARMAVDVSPETIRYRLLLAKVLVAQGAEDEARQVLEELLQLPVRTDDERRQRSEAEELLAGL